MSDRIVIVAEPRTVTGKKVKQLRREGYVPAVIYGQAEPVSIQIETLPLRRALRVAGTRELATIDVAGKQYTVLAREIQQHVTRRDILHVDFMEVDMKSTITSEAEIVTIGESPAVESGEGMINVTLYSIEIECLPDNLISTIEVDLGLIQTTDDAIYVSDLVAPEGVTILTDPETQIARFEFSRAGSGGKEDQEFGEMEAGEVEVIGEEGHEAAGG